MQSQSCNHLLRTPYSCSPTTNLLPHRKSSSKIPFSVSTTKKRVHFSCGIIRAVDGGRSETRTGHVSPWDDEAYEVLPSGKKSYLDEQDVVTFLDPPKELIPLDPSSYNPAAYLWKKIEDIPEERRYRLLTLLEPKLISRAWQIAGTRYDDPKFAKKCSSKLLSTENWETTLEFYSCRSSGGPALWIKSFKMAVFRCDNGMKYGRFIGGSILSRIANTVSPLYFMVTPLKEVMSTEQPCDLAYDFGDGHLDLHSYPQGFPRPGKHPHPFDDQAIVYVRHVGPGVLVGQAWQEGKELQQVPQKLCGEILMVKDYGA